MPSQLYGPRRPAGKVCSNERAHWKQPWFKPSLLENQELHCTDGDCPASDEMGGNGLKFILTANRHFRCHEAFPLRK